MFPELTVHSFRFTVPVHVNHEGCNLICLLYLVRHGEVSNPNHVVYGDLPGFHLSSTGVQQAHGAGTHLAHAALDLILSSPLDRARETAIAIARHHALVPTVDDRLTESRQFPHWTGNRWDSIAELFPNQLESYLENASNVGYEEQLTDVVQRYASVVDEAAAMDHTGIVVVGHQDPVQALRLSLTHRPLGELRRDPPRHGEVITLASSGGVDWTEQSRWSPEASTR